MKFHIRRNIFLVVAAGILVAALSISVTFMLLTAEGPTATNTIQISQEGVQVDEPHFDPDIKPGKTVYKDPRVRNTGTADSYIRVTVAGGIDNPSWTYPVMIPTFDSTLVKQDSVWTLPSDPSPPKAPVSGTPSTAYYNTNKWYQDPSNKSVWYYKEIVPPGGVTEPLFTSVTLSIDYLGDGSDLDIIIYAESIQANYLTENGVPGKSSAEAAMAAFAKFK